MHTQPINSANSRPRWHSALQLESDTKAQSIYLTQHAQDMPKSKTATKSACSGELQQKKQHCTRLSSPSGRCTAQLTHFASTHIAWLLTTTPFTAPEEPTHPRDQPRHTAVTNHHTLSVKRTLHTNSIQTKFGWSMDWLDALSASKHHMHAAACQHPGRCQPQHQQPNSLIPQPLPLKTGPAATNSPATKEDCRTSQAERKGGPAASMLHDSCPAN